jgi:hypothetical protein
VRVHFYKAQMLESSPSEYPSPMCPHGSKYSSSFLLSLWHVHAIHLNCLLVSSAGEAPKFYGGGLVGGAAAAASMPAVEIARAAALKRQSDRAAAMSVGAQKGLGKKKKATLVGKIEEYYAKMDKVGLAVCIAPLLGFGFFLTRRMVTVCCLLF